MADGSSTGGTGNAGIALRTGAGSAGIALRTGASMDGTVEVVRGAIAGIVVRTGEPTSGGVDARGTGGVE